MWFRIKLLWFVKESLQFRISIKFQEGEAIKMKKLYFKLKQMTINSLEQLRKLKNSP